MRFHHSGKLGDIIYALPAIKACRSATLYLSAPSEFGFTSEQAFQLLPLLKEQPYIQGVELYSGQNFDYDLDQFRKLGPATNNIADCHLKVLGLSPAWRDEAWLSVSHGVRERPSDRSVIFARSLAHHGIDGFWPECLAQFGDKAAFVGTETEHANFVERFGTVPFLRTKNLLQLAQAISGANLFIGNQSCPFAIAEGLKAAVIQETCGVRNCIFERSRALHVESAEQLSSIRPFYESCVLAGQENAS